MKMKSFSIVGKTVVFLLTIVPIMIICVVLMATGVAEPFIDCFAVDSDGTLYIAKGEQIEIYKEEKMLGTIDVHTSRGYSFIIEYDEIWLDKGEYVYSLDLKNEAIKKAKLGDVEKWKRHEMTTNLNDKIAGGKKQYTTACGDVYELKQPLAWTCITKNDSTILYQITPVSFIIKLFLYVCVIATFVFVAISIKPWKEFIARGDSSLC